MARLEVPVVVCIIGEGGSGGALGIAVGNRILMQENAIYTVITPEGCSAILWKDQEHVEVAAAALKITAADLKALGVIDEIVPEPAGGAHLDHDAAADLLDKQLRPCLESLLRKSPRSCAGSDTRNSASSAPSALRHAAFRKIIKKDKSRPRITRINTMGASASRVPRGAVGPPIHASISFVEFVIIRGLLLFSPKI